MTRKEPIKDCVVSLRCDRSTKEFLENLAESNGCFSIASGIPAYSERGKDRKRTNIEVTQRIIWWGSMTIEHGRHLGPVLPKGMAHGLGQSIH